MIVLTVVSFRGAPADGPSARFGEDGGSIGRADGNRLVLPDPERNISRQHARIVYSAGQYAVVDNGSNPIAVNQQPLPLGQAQVLWPGDLLQVGGYVLQVSQGPAQARDASGLATPEDPWALPVAWDSSPAAALPPAPVPAQRPAAATGQHTVQQTVDAGPGPSAATGTDPLIAALLQGLATPGLRIDTLTPERMLLLGQLLRESTRGAVELLATRAAVRREMRATATRIQARDNNPLKFSPSVDAALLHLLGPPVAGFQAPAAAMRDAFDDLHAHQLGLVAGLQAAMAGMLQRFDPQQLEDRLAGRGGLAGLIPATRKARLWELFQQLFDQLSAEAQEDGQALFGQAFLQAYDAQLDRLQTDDPDRR